VSLTAEILAEVRLDSIGTVVANDSARSSFTVPSGDRLLALDADLNVLAEWPAGPLNRGSHATSPGRGLALISGPGEVRLLDRAGQVLWHHAHAPWSGAFESGCTWFDHAGEPHAVVPPPDHYDGCLVRRFDLESGQVVAEAPIEAAPAGIEPLHHPDGWVGLSEGEGQDAAKAWWVRSRLDNSGAAELDILDAGWRDWILADVDPAGTRIITLPHVSRDDTGPLLVRSFPGLDIIQSFDLPGDHGWFFNARFSGDLIIAPMLSYEGDDERLAAIDGSGTFHDLGKWDGSILQAADRTWLSVTRTRIRRYRAT
jgi:hypothetical protein